MIPALDIDDGAQAPALDIGPILAIHRDPGGYIGFCRKPDPAAPPRLDKHGKPYLWDNLFSIRVDDLESMFPALQEWILHDSYMTVNTMFRAAPYANKLTGHPDVWRKEKHLRSLTACYADIDCGRPESTEPGAARTWRDALHRAGVLADAGVIPQPSIMARSGRGAYLFWLLRDADDPSKLPHAWMDSTIPLYKAINKAIDERLLTCSLPADIRAIDAARVLRVPGSIHRQAGRRVSYVIQADADGRGFVYTLPELAQALDIPSLTPTLPAATRALARPAQYRTVKKPGSAPRRAKGCKSVNAQRASDLVKLQEYRGGFKRRGDVYPDGHTSPGRRFILSLYVNFLRGSGLAQDDAIDALRAMASNMIPAWPDDPGDPTIEALAAQEYARSGRRRWPDKKLIPMLGITEALADEIDLHTIVPAAVREARAAALPTQQEVIERRREWLRKYIIEHGGDWTGPRVMNLSALSPYAWNNHFTATQDLNAIGYQVRRPGRPRKKKVMR